MQRHRIGATAAAMIIVRQIAPTLPKAAETDLLGPCTKERERINHLRDVTRKAGSERARGRYALGCPTNGSCRGAFACRTLNRSARPITHR
jgi:hypothetical protein